MTSTIKTVTEKNYRCQDCGRLYARKGAECKYCGGNDIVSRCTPPKYGVETQIEHKDAGEFLTATHTLYNPTRENVGAYWDGNLMSDAEKKADEHAEGSLHFIYRDGTTFYRGGIKTLGEAQAIFAKLLVIFGKGATEEAKAKAGELGFVEA